LQIGSLPPFSLAQLHGNARPCSETSSSTAKCDATDPASEESKQTGKQQLSQDQQRQVTKLKQRDQEVRAHEAAHMAAAGGLASGGASFSYERGPDGRLYAVGGEVGIDTSAIKGDPEATLRKAQQIRAAALAPAQPSAQDQAVAAQAAAMEAAARSELAAQGEQDNAQTSGAKTATNNNSVQKNIESEAVNRYQEVAASGAEESDKGGINLRV
jgi:hypothetical protein